MMEGSTAEYVTQMWVRLHTRLTNWVNIQYGYRSGVVGTWLPTVGRESLLSTTIYHWIINQIMNHPISRINSEQQMGICSMVGHYYRTNNCWRSGTEPTNHGNMLWTPMDYGRDVINQRKVGGWLQSQKKGQSTLKTAKLVLDMMWCKPK